MMLRMDGLVKRGGVYQFRRGVPLRLRSIVGKREWTESLDTTDESVARTRWKVVQERVERVFREAEAGVKSPAVVGYRAVQAWRDERFVMPSRPGEEEALDAHLTTLLARDNLDATRRAALEALLPAESSFPSFGLLDSP
jgi:hypothetical protein